MSWGTKIAFLYVSFAVMIGFMVYKSSTQTVDLVAPNYYEQELKYQDKIDGINNLNAESNAISIAQYNHQLLLTFDIALGSPVGKILLFKPDNAAADFETIISADAAGKQTINTDGLSKGTYLIKVDWKIGSKKYFKEERISIN
jgi:hypothetical protein